MNGLQAAGWVIGLVMVVVACSESAPNDDGDGASGPATTTTGAGGGATSSAMSTTGSGSALICNEPVSNLDGECDLLQQDCEPGMWCNVVNNERKCVPYYEASKGKKDPCAGNSECKPGLICVNDKCTPFCCPETDEPCEGGICDSSVNFGSGWAMVCSYQAICALFEQNCEAGSYCHVSSYADGLAVCDPPSPNPVNEGEECAFRNDCGDSQLCNLNSPDGDGSTGLCRYFCKPSDAQNLDPGKGGCPADRTCTALNAGAFEDLGMCAAN